jgi:nitrogen fixation-related uncharacterized protein
VEVTCSARGQHQRRDHRKRRPVYEQSKQPPNRYRASHGGRSLGARCAIAIAVILTQNVQTRVTFSFEVRLCPGSAEAIGVFLWSLKSGQYDDLDGAAERILYDGHDRLIVEGQARGTPGLMSGEFEQSAESERGRAVQR